jgi:hypothetical protein
MSDAAKAVGKTPTPSTANAGYASIALCSMMHPGSVDTRHCVGVDSVWIQVPCHTQEGLCILPPGHTDNHTLCNDPSGRAPTQPTSGSVPTPCNTQALMTTACGCMHHTRAALHGLHKRPAHTHTGPCTTHHHARENKHQQAAMVTDDRLVTPQGHTGSHLTGMTLLPVHCRHPQGSLDAQPEAPFSCFTVLVT